MISFIVIGKNEGWKLRKCFHSIIASVNKLPIKDFEILYIDSRSTDESVGIAKECRIVRIFQIEGLCNAAIARNIGGSEAKGDILIFLDGDMELNTDFLPFVIKNNELIYPFITGLYNYCYYDKNHKIVKERIFNDKGRSVYTGVPGGFFIILKHLWQQCKGMDIRLSVNEDYDLGLRMHLIMPLKQVEVKGINHNTYIDKFVSHIWRISYSYRYTAVLTRKNILNRHYYPLFLRNNYTSIFLCVSIALSFLNIYCLGIYVMAILLRSFINVNHTHAKMIFFFLLRDFVIITSLIVYYPRTPRIVYHSM